MEAAPLTLAHSHARNALLETRRSNPVAASEEHDLAAAEFAAAAQGTGDVEALRILNLLEQHHKKLGQILKSRHDNPPVDQTTISESPKSQTAVANLNTAASTSAERETRTSSPETTQHPPHLSSGTRAAGRELPSSITSDLAKARGIPRKQQGVGNPASPAVSTHHAGGKFSNDQATPVRSPVNTRSSGRVIQGHLSREPHPRPSWTPPPATAAEKEENTSDETNASPTDAPFQHFYNTFESLISKISAPLAFAGLPLASPSASTLPHPKNPAVSSASKSRQARPQAPNIPVSADSLDFSQLFSKAALRAVRDGAPRPNPAESFFFVPTAGGTTSYAEVARLPDQEISRHNRHLIHISEDDEDLVNTRDPVPSPMAAEFSPTGPGANSRRGSVRPAPNSTESQKAPGKTMEELALENQMLRQYLDSTSKRLRVFELSAQSSSAALAQSIRSLQRSPAPTPENSRGKSEAHSSSGRGGGDEKARARIMELEEILHKNDKELQRREKENAKLKDVVVRYREKWEKLKEGARARREGGERTKVLEDGAAE